MATKKKTRKKSATETKMTALAKSIRTQVKAFEKLVIAEHKRLAKLAEKSEKENGKLDEQIDALVDPYTGAAKEEKQQAKLDALREKRDALPNYEDAQQALGDEDAYPDDCNLFAEVNALTDACENLLGIDGKNPILADYFDEVAKLDA